MTTQENTQTSTNSNENRQKLDLAVGLAFVAASFVAAIGLIFLFLGAFGVTLGQFI